MIGRNGSQHPARPPKARQRPHHVVCLSPAYGVFQPRPSGAAALQPAACGAWGCPACRLASRGCAALPTHRPALHTTYVPTGQSGARRAIGSVGPRREHLAGESPPRGPKTRCSCTEFRECGTHRSLGSAQKRLILQVLWGRSSCNFSSF